jgi:hypothetical protein
MLAFLRATGISRAIGTHMSPTTIAVRKAKEKTAASTLSLVRRVIRCFLLAGLSRHSAP